MQRSPDDGASHGKFISKYRLPFTLLSDPGRKVMTKYGAFGEKMMYGKKVIGIIRSTVWIGPDDTTASPGGNRWWPRLP